MSGGSRRRFEFVEGGSSKFWEIEVDGASFTVTFGRIGSSGQTKTKKCANVDAAKAEAEKLVAEKVKKGYRHASGRVPTAKVKASKETAASAFPRLTWTDHGWQGRDRFESWAGFMTANSSRRSTGLVKIDVPAPGSERIPPLPAQVAAYTYLRANEDAVTRAVLKPIWKDYPENARRYNEEQFADDGDDEDDVVLEVERSLGIRSGRLPTLRRIDGLREVIGLHRIHVLPVAKQGIAYLGFELRCEWDDEHGIGVMLHRSRVVASGGGDHAILEWIAERDGGIALTPSSK